MVAAKPVEAVLQSGPRGLTPRIGVLGEPAVSQSGQHALRNTHARALVEFLQDLAETFRVEVVEFYDLLERFDVSLNHFGIQI